MVVSGCAAAVGRCRAAMREVLAAGVSVNLCKCVGWGGELDAGTPSPSLPQAACSVAGESMPISLGAEGLS